MNCSYKITLLALILSIFLGLTTYAPTSAQNTDLSVSPSKGPADAPVEVAVFSCFE